MFLPNYDFFFIFKDKISFSQRNFNIFVPFQRLFIDFTSFWLFWTVLSGFGEIKKSKMADQYGRRLEIMT